MELVATGRVCAPNAFYTKGEELFNAISHIVGAALGLLFGILGVFFAYPDPAAVAAMAVFGVCVVTLYTMSALYHFLPAGGKAKRVFRVFDHCTIFLLIAGTYTPYCLIVFYGTPLGRGILAAQWILAAAGITMNAIAMNRKTVKAISMVLYVVMGWMALGFLRPIIPLVSAASFWLLLGGGIAYTVGIVFFALGKKVKWFHPVWHLFDILGTTLQFFSILFILI